MVNGNTSMKIITVSRLLFCFEGSDDFLGTSVAFKVIQTACLIQIKLEKSVFSIYSNVNIEHIQAKKADLMYMVTKSY